MKRLRIHITGVVQGVGFRPFVAGLAKRMGVAGFVRNTSCGVVVEAEGKALDTFCKRLRSEAPPLANITGFETETISETGDRGFLIRSSDGDGGATQISPDVSICADCRRELLDPEDRRFLYPFINCTNCGPRYTITRAVPYDRPNTTMASFDMCEACRAEYDDPGDRRFHAQPNACGACGPDVVFMDDRGEKASGRGALVEAVRELKKGRIVAIKGLGGFHLAADALNERAVRELRDRKRRSNKSFALMAPDPESVAGFCDVSEEARRLLLSRARPIVLLPAKPDDRLAGAVAPCSTERGFMLPYTPLHELLFWIPLDGGETFAETAHFEALVMTSGNMSEEPIVKENDGVRKELFELADFYLVHDRDIFMRVDDSVTRVFGEQTVFIRRARGFVPTAVPLQGNGPQVLACGADMKNTFALTRDDSVIVSQHIGDLENLETIDFFEETLENLKRVYRVTPEAIVHDLHPGYHSTRWAFEQETLPLWGIQHHYAHTASVMASAGLRDKVIGVSLDGTGFGPDETVWGGEFLIADIDGFERVARFRPVPLPGGNAGVRFPWMMAISYVATALGDEAPVTFEALGFHDRHGAGAIANCLKLLGNRDLSLLTSSAGRLFDAVSALLGITDVNTFEGEAAMALEAAAVADVPEVYGYELLGSEIGEIDFTETIGGILENINTKTHPGIIASRFHNTVVQAVLDMVFRVHKGSGIREIVLSGGVFQNRRLLQGVVEGLRSKGLHPHFNTIVPANDGGISLGQAYIVRERMRGKQD